MYKTKKKTTGQSSSSSTSSTSSTSEEEEQGSTGCTVWLGVKGKEIKLTVKEKEEEVADAYTSKIGGWPVRS
jgi:DNA relaxase NicK